MEFNADCYMRPDIFIFERNGITIYWKPTSISPKAGVKSIHDKQMRQPLISIIITCYNYGRFLEECLLSAIHSGYENQEIIVIDDNSPEAETIQVLAECQQKYPNVRFVPLSENGGVSRARNTGIRICKGEYFICIDADDTLVHGALEKLAIKLTSTTNRAFAYGSYELTGAESKIITPPPYSYIKLRFGNYIICSALCSKEAWLKAGGYEESRSLLLEDWNFWLSVSKLGYIGTCVNTNVIKYRKHGESRNSRAIRNHFRQTVLIGRLQKDPLIFLGLVVYAVMAGGGSIMRFLKLKK